MNSSNDDLDDPYWNRNHLTGGHPGLFRLRALPKENVERKDKRNG